MLPLAWPSPMIRAGLVAATATIRSSGSPRLWCPSLTRTGAESQALGSRATPSRCRLLWRRYRGARDRWRPCQSLRRATLATAVRGRTLPERRIDLADIASGPADVVREIVRTGLDVHHGAGTPVTQRRLQRLRRRCVDDVERCACRVRDIGGALHRVGFDKGRARRVPSLEASGALRIACFQPIAQYPRDFNGFRMRTHHAAIAAAASQSRNKKPSSISGRPRRAPSPPRLFMNILKLGAPYLRT